MLFEVAASCYCSVPELRIYILLRRVELSHFHYLTIFTPCPTKNCAILCWFSAHFVTYDLLYSH
jgi:hypothetical protein